jgi:adhesin hecA
MPEDLQSIIDSLKQNIDTIRSGNGINGSIRRAEERLHNALQQLHVCDNLSSLHAQQLIRSVVSTLDNNRRLLGTYQEKVQDFESRVGTDSANRLTSGEGDANNNHKSAGSSMSEASRKETHDSENNAERIVKKATDSSNGLSNYYGLGSGTMEEAREAGMKWVGDNGRESTNRPGRIWVSEDGLRQWRAPSFKPKLGKWQSNFEARERPNGSWTSNGHLDISDPPERTS